MKKLLLLLIVAMLYNCNNVNKEAAIVEQEETVEEVATKAAGSDNNLHFDVDKTKVKWTAFKTPEKVAVHGSFDSIVVENTKESIIPEEVLEGATFTIYTSTMTTGDASRDAKIIGLFFNNLEGNTIHGTVGKFENGTVPIELVMNEKFASKDFKYTLENRKMVITGVIDIIEDFEANKSFDILHDACSALHLDKTWTDVSIEVISNLEKDVE